MRSSTCFLCAGLLACAALSFSGFGPLSSSTAVGTPLLIAQISTAPSGADIHGPGSGYRVGSGVIPTPSVSPSLTPSTGATPFTTPSTGATPGTTPSTGAVSPGITPTPTVTPS